MNPVIEAKDSITAPIRKWLDMKAKIRGVVFGRNGEYLKHFVNNSPGITIHDPFSQNQSDKSVTLSGTTKLFCENWSHARRAFEYIYLKLICLYYYIFYGSFCSQVFCLKNDLNICLV